MATIYINFLKMQLTEFFAHFARYQFFNAYHYIDLIQEWRVYYSSPHEPRYRHLRVKHPFVHVKCQIIISAIMMMRSITYIYSQVNRVHNYQRFKYYTGTMLLPDSAAVNIETSVVLWSILNLIHLVFILPSKLCAYTYLVPMAIDVYENVTPKHLNLDSGQFEKLSKLRKISMQYNLSITSSMLIFPTIFFFYRFIVLYNDSSLFEKCTSILWFPLIFMWIVYACFCK